MRMNYDEGLLNLSTSQTTIEKQQRSQSNDINTHF